MERRTFLQSLSAGTIGAALHPLSAQSAADPVRRNVLFIASDDLNDWIEPLGGHPATRTPNINRLASRGVLFSKAYCAGPVCNPSRTSLLSGLAPSTSGVYHNDQPWQAALPGVVTLPEYFMQHGYHVTGSGKIFHMNYHEDKRWHAYMKTPRTPEPKQRQNGLDRATDNFDWGPIDVPDEAMADYKVASNAIDYLQQAHDRPFFCACGIFKPHLPWFVPRKYFDLFPLEEIVLPIVNENDLDDLPPAGRAMASADRDHKFVVEGHQWRQAVQAYLAAIAFADAQIGRVLDALENSRYADNTVVVLWGDHGWHLGEKSAWRKAKLWEESNRTPLIISVPGLTPQGIPCLRPVSLLDIYPTLVEICGLPKHPRLEGHSLTPLLKNPIAPWEYPVVMSQSAENHAVRTERWRYIRYGDGGEELYDHEWDPYEWNNLADHPRFAAVKRELASHLPKNPAPEAKRDRDFR